MHGQGLSRGRRWLRLVGNSNSCVYLLQPATGGARHLNVAAVKKNWVAAQVRLDKSRRQQVSREICSGKPLIINCFSPQNPTHESLSHLFTITISRTVSFIEFAGFSFLGTFTRLIPGFPTKTIEKILFT